MTDKFKMFGSNYPDHVPSHILKGRMEQSDAQEEVNKNTLRVLGATVMSGLVAVAGVMAVNFNRSHQNDKQPNPPSQSDSPSERLTNHTEDV